MTVARDPVGRLLHVLEASPDAVAVLDASGPTTYRAFVAEAAGFARMARDRSPSGEPMVALILRGRQARTYAAMFGTLIAGGVYAPLNAAWPTARIADALRQLQPDLIISDHDVAAAVRGAGVDPARIVGLDDVVSGDPTALEPSATQDAYVIFTSGSTGSPKGVVVRRSALGNYLDWVMSSIGPRVGERWSQHADISFDLSVLDIFGCLCAGATLCPMESRVDRLFPARFVERNRIDIWVSVPSVVDAMLAADAVSADLLGSLRIMVFCGEALRPHHVEPLFTALPELVILNTYGPTENTVSCTEERLTRAGWASAARGSIAIGGPIPGTRMVLDRVAGAVTGEILLGGEQLAAGYLGSDPGVPGPFVVVDGERWYRTGDLAEVVDGRTYFVGRLDSQVKVRGHRIELDEVSGAASEILGVAAAAAVVEDRIVLAFEGDEGRVDELIGRLRDMLPDYMVPSTVLGVPALPRTPNGKTDRAGIVGLLEAERRVT